MSLDLDDRQRAMLAEMGVPVWWPSASATAIAEMPQGAAVPSPPPRAVEIIASNADLARAGLQKQRRPAVATATPTALLPLAAGIASMDWPGLRTTVQQCQACRLCLGRRAPVLAAPESHFQADWMVLGDPPDDAQEQAGQPYVGAAGELLDNMLKAVGVRREAAYLSHVLKCRPALPSAPDAQALANCANYLQREIALVQPKVILAMGRLAMQVLLGQDHPEGLKLPLSRLRGHAWHYQGVPVVVTYPPEYLLHTGQDKARAWEDLCFALALVQRVA